jgi:hypothetical protein
MLNLIRIFWDPWRWRSCSAETCRSKIDILNIWFNLKIPFVGLSFITIWKCMVLAEKKTEPRHVFLFSLNISVGTKWVLIKSVSSQRREFKVREQPQWFLTSSMFKLHFRNKRNALCEDCVLLSVTSSLQFSVCFSVFRLPNFND